MELRFTGERFPTDSCSPPRARHRENPPERSERGLDASRGALMRARSARRALIAMVAGVLACGGDAVGPPRIGTMVEHRVRPSVTSGAITRWNQDHYAWIARSTIGREGRLLLLLPGTNGTPSHATRVGRE